MDTLFTEMHKELITDFNIQSEPGSVSPAVGLSTSEVRELRARGLGNNIKLKTGRTYFQILRENLFTFFNFVLFGLGIALVILDKPVEAVITSGVVLTNVVLAMIQELRAKRKLDQIALLKRPRVTAIRDGVETHIDPGEVVVGDVLAVSVGDQIVVDGTVIGDGRMNVDESLLSGEADLIPKRSGDPVYSGSFCIAGSARYVAQKVGLQSVVNKLAISARSFQRRYTPLQREVNLIIRVLLGVVAFFLTLNIITTILQKSTLLESVRAASVLFGLTPSSLFLMIVVAYAWGAVRIAGKGALVQQANSIESLCNVTMLCLDKTGTLTTNRIRLDRILPVHGSSPVTTSVDLERALGTYARSLTSPTRTSNAIVDACPGDNSAPHEEVLFSSQLGWSALSYKSGPMSGTWVLGAPETLFSHIDGASYHAGDSGQALEECFTELTSRGMRVLLFAHFPDPVPLHDAEGVPIMLPGLLPLSLLCFADELRPSVQETLQGFDGMGIELKVISGDNPSTVVSLARQVGLIEPSEDVQAISGTELLDMAEADFDTAVLTNRVFGRVTPDLKRRLVKSLRRQGHYVAMTGDGVNDVMALKQADLGIAMQSGSQATRNVAGMVLLNDSFDVLPQAFAEGQRILNGMEDILRLYLTRILYFALLIAAMGWLGNGSPFSPKQNSLISILTLSLPAFALAFWARPGSMPRSSMIKRLSHFIVPAAITTAAAGLVIYIYAILRTADAIYAQTVLTYTMIPVGLLLVVFVEPPTRFWVSGDAFSGDWRPTLLVLGIFLLFLTLFGFPMVRDLYDLVPLWNPLDYMAIGLVVIGWTFTLRFVWRLHLLDRYLDIDLGGP